METTLVKLKSEFNDIINIRNNVKNIFDILQVRIDKLHQIYYEFIKTNKNEMFVFGLDTFHFQSKLIDIEYDDMKRLFLVINNRMYCEYFKLHKIIVEYISKSVTDKKVTEIVKINNFPIYKDLEPFKEYKFEIILNIHENILNLLAILMSIINNKENELNIHKIKLNIGLNIDNFITSFNFDIIIMKEKIMMFITYIDFFHKMHTKYLKRFSNKIQSMYAHINNDIKFDDSLEISRNKKKESIDKFSTDNMDNKLLKELNPLGCENNSDVSDTNSNSSAQSIKTLDTHDSVISLNFSTLQQNDTKSNLKFKNPTQLYMNKEKKDYKNIFQRNIDKVTNMLKISKLTKDNRIEANNKDKIATETSDKDIEEFIHGIEESCDSIINKSNERPFLESENIKLLTISNNNLEEKINQIIPVNYEEHKIFDLENGEKNDKKENVIEKEEQYVVEEEPNDNLEEQEQGLVEEQEDGLVEEQEDGLVEEQEQGIVEEQEQGIVEEQEQGIVEEQEQGIVEEQEQGIVEEQEQIIETEKVEEPNISEVISVEEPEVKENNVTLIETHEQVKKKRPYNKKKK